MCSWCAATNRNRTGAGTANANVYIAHIISERIELGLLNERSSAIVGSRYMAAACLPGHVHRSIRTIHRNRWLGGICLRRGRNLSGKANDIPGPRRWGGQQERSQAQKTPQHRHPKIEGAMVSHKDRARQPHPSSHRFSPSANRQREDRCFPVFKELSWRTGTNLLVG